MCLQRAGESRGHTRRLFVKGGSCLRSCVTFPRNVPENHRTFTFTGGLKAETLSTTCSKNNPALVSTFRSGENSACPTDKELRRWVLAGADTGQSDYVLGCPLCSGPEIWWEDVFLDSY